MANLKKHHEAIYYNQEDLFGNYQFVSLEDIIDQFMAVYVGSEKLINKANKLDVAFHAQRALAELSFDTLKSFKSQQIEIPPSLTMILPHDYVNYTKISWVDDKGIKHPLYYTKDTNNPFHIRQLDNGDYDFPNNDDLLINSDFESDDFGKFAAWQNSYQIKTGGSAGVPGTKDALSTPGTFYNHAFLELGFTGNTVLKHRLAPSIIAGDIAGTARCTWQKINVIGVDYINFDGRAESTAAITGNATGIAGTDSAGNTVTSAPNYTVSTGNYYATDSGNSGGLWTVRNSLIAGNTSGTSSVDPGDEGDIILSNIPSSTVRIGFSTSPGDININMTNNQYYNTPSLNSTTGIFNLNSPDGQAYVEWFNGESGYKEINGVDVREHDYVYLLVCSFAEWDNAAYGEANTTLFVQTQIDDLTVANAYSGNNLQERSTLAGISGAWQNYKATTPVENNTEDYVDEQYWPFQGERYGLEPSHAQVNGSFYIDELRGKINFSSNVSGKNVILDYISDSLGTEKEMQVHKFVEEAMYKWITYGVLSSKINIPEYIVQRAKKEKFAATRQAKLRLSNLKIEDLTRMLRGKSKQIKH